MSHSCTIREAEIASLLYVFILEHETKKSKSFDPLKNIFYYIPCFRVPECFELRLFTSDTGRCHSKRLQV